MCSFEKYTILLKIEIINVKNCTIKQFTAPRIESKKMIYR